MKVNSEFGGRWHQAHAQSFIYPNSTAQKSRKKLVMVIALLSQLG
jgi:hypothetical protein